MAHPRDAVTSVKDKRNASAGCGNIKQSHRSVGCRFIVTQYAEGMLGFRLYPQKASEGSRSAFVVASLSLVGPITRIKRIYTDSTDFF